MYHNAPKPRQPPPHAEQKGRLKNASSSGSDYFNITFLLFFFFFATSNNAFSCPQLIILTEKSRGQWGMAEQFHFLMQSMGFKAWVPLRA